MIKTSIRNVYFRGQVAVYRRTVPGDLKAVYEKGTIWVNLGVAPDKLSGPAFSRLRTRAAELDELYDREFATHRRSMRRDTVSVPASDIAEPIVAKRSRVYDPSEFISAIDHWLLMAKTQARDDYLSGSRDPFPLFGEEHHLRGKLQSDLLETTFNKIKGFEELYHFALSSINPPPPADFFLTRHHSRYFAQSWKRLLDFEDELNRAALMPERYTIPELDDDGDDEQERTESHTKLVHSKQAGAVPKLTFKQVVESYLKTKRETGSGESKLRIAVRVLYIQVGENISPTDLNTEIISNFAKTCLNLPKRFSYLQGADFKNIILSPPESDPDELLHPKTVKSYIDMLKAAYHHGTSSGWYEKRDIFQGAKNIISSVKKKKTEYFYLDEELKPLFLTLYEHHLKNPKSIKGAVFWIATIALHTGARSAEVAYLRRSNIITKDGVKCLRFEDTEATRLKNESSQRTIPIHPELLKMGFLQYAETKDLYLFDQSKTTSQYDGSTIPNVDYYGKVFGKVRDNLMFPRRFRFHAFRHSFTDLAVNSSIADGIRKSIQGWAETYGDGASILTMFDALSKIKVTGYPYEELSKMRDGLISNANRKRKK